MEELIKTLEEIKEHQMQTVQLARTTTVYKLADKAIKQALSLAAVEGRGEQFNCLGGNHAKGIKPCSEWCGEDMCQKPSN